MRDATRPRVHAFYYTVISHHRFTKRLSRGAGSHTALLHFMLAYTWQTLPANMPAHAGAHCLPSSYTGHECVCDRRMGSRCAPMPHACIRHNFKFAYIQQRLGSLWRFCKLKARYFVHAMAAEWAQGSARDYSKAFRLSA